MTKLNLAWAAGLFDGEGCTKVDRRWGTPSVTLSQSGERVPEVLVRFRDAVGRGSIYGPYKTKKRPMWIWQCAKRADREFVMKQLWPWLGTTKREQWLRANSD